MNTTDRQRVQKMVKLLAREDYRWLLQIKIHESEFGYDPFGLERRSGYFERGEMVTPFEDAALKMKMGEIRDCRDTCFGLGR